MDKNGASRTPADELPTMQAAFFINSEKWENRIDGKIRKRSVGSLLIATIMSSDPGSLLGKTTTKFLPDASSAPNKFFA